MRHCSPLIKISNDLRPFKNITPTYSDVKMKFMSGTDS